MWLGKALYLDGFHPVLSALSGSKAPRGIMSEQTQEPMSAGQEKRWRKTAAAFPTGYWPAAALQELFSEIDRLRSQLASAERERDQIKANLVRVTNNLINRWAVTFSNYAWSDAETAVDLMFAEIYTCRKERDEARAERDQMKEALLLAEWTPANQDGAQYCNCCGRQKWNGHNSVCRVAAALAPIEDEAPKPPSIEYDPDALTGCADDAVDAAIVEKIRAMIPAGWTPRQFADAFNNYVPPLASPHSSPSPEGGQARQAQPVCEPENNKHVFIASAICQCGATQDEAMISASLKPRVKTAEHVSVPEPNTQGVSVEAERARQSSLDDRIEWARSYNWTPEGKQEFIRKFAEANVELDRVESADAQGGQDRQSEDPRASYDPKPKPSWACPGYGHWGHNHKTCTGCVDAAADSLRNVAKAPQFTDRERLDWLAWDIISTEDGVPFIPGLTNKSWNGGEFHKAIDAAMLAAGLSPKPREKVTRRELQKACEHRCHWDDIRAVLAAATDAQGNMKEIVES
jgi:hypothetical protein